MLNNVVLIGCLCGKPEKSNSPLEKSKEKIFNFFKFCVSVKKPVLSHWEKKNFDIINVITFDFNIKKYIKILTHNHILAIKGRIINFNNETVVFANTIILIGKKQ